VLRTDDLIKILIPQNAGPSTKSETSPEVQIPGAPKKTLLILEFAIPNLASYGSGYARLWILSVCWRRGESKGWPYFICPIKNVNQLFRRFKINQTGFQVVQVHDIVPVVF
jgi:hypothetical protein